jgi:hypothetical protein
MSAPNNERPWAPAELDALEDALESLEHADAPTLPGTLSPEQQQRIAERLASYRKIAGLSRELLLAHVAPPTAIASAIAVAREPAPHEAGGGEIAAPREPATSWWSRMRRLWLVPAFATAGVGALVVVLSIDANRSEPATVASGESSPAVDGVKQDMRENASSAPALAMKEPTAAADDKATFGVDATLRGSAAAESGDGQRGRLLEPKPADTPAEAQAQLESTLDAGEELERRDEPKRKADVAHAKDNENVAPRSDPAPATEPTSPRASPSQPQPKSPPQPAKPQSKKSGGGGAPGGSTAGADTPSAAAIGDVLVRADRARRGGDCDAARRDYDLVIAKGDRKQRARAKAGKALCLEREGAEASAGDLIAAARQDDPSIDAWIADERGE